ncbi:glycosyltransferase family protein [Micromonospora polyrhachis]|uniref:DUF6311 domain-containing protein n=1 Tax=Micromonospora polyrhachis TaxID=1282883 RepID=A0A7W7SM08_9ACTN|nr:hypothetical protein [Micromonospora polyrhachis]MBB4957277.1 hypothetical protein [Micromonospora polyrhachis]
MAEAGATTEPAGRVDASLAGADPTGDRARVGGRRRFGARWWHRPWWFDAAVIGGYLLVALYVTSRLWHPERMVHMENDQMLLEWMLARAAQAVTQGENPFYSTQLNAPDGINLMANISVLGFGIPLTPVTVLFGSQTTFVLSLILSLGGTAAAWYLFLSRRLVRSRFAAALGGLFCGFAPGMISQAGGHLHMVAQFLVPAILWIVFSPVTDRILRQGVLLGLLVSYQVFLAEEVLLFLVLACGLFTVVHVLADRTGARRLARAFLGRIAVGAGTALVLLAYPLWYQFFGPGHYRGLPFNKESYALDLGSFATSGQQSITGHEQASRLLAPNATEENSFFGLALIVLCAVVAVWLWRRPMVKALAVCGFTFAVLSLGVQVRLDGKLTDLPGPYRLISAVPLIDLAVPARFPLICIPVVAILLALSLDRVFRSTPVSRAGSAGGGTPPGGTPAISATSGEGERVPVRLLWTGAVLAVLLPLVPTPIRTDPVWPVPEFVTSGQWRSYVPPGRSLVPVPPSGGGEATAGMYWSARTRLAFTAPGGYFIGPTSPDDPTGRWGPVDRPTAVLLNEVARTGQIPPITDEHRRQAIEDLRHWRAAIVVQGGLHRGYPVKETVDLLLGPGQEIAGAWVWDVRDRVSID